MLYTYGGAYIDDDSDMKSPLDSIIQPHDEIIVSIEKNGFNGDVCWIPRYHLSDFMTFSGNQTKINFNIFENRVLLNWS